MIRVVPIAGKGRGVVAELHLKAGDVIEVAPVAIIPQAQSNDYVFPWDDTHYAIAFGKISLCNHSYEPNCYWVLDDRHQTITLIAAKDIGDGEELTIPYNCKLWFELHDEGERGSGG